MICRPILFSVIALGVALSTVPAACAENPLEKLHKKIFGDDDRKKNDDKKKKEKDRKRDHDDDHRHDDRRYDDRRSDDRDHDRRYYDDRRSYEAPVTVERRVYIEPAPRVYERRSDYDEPAQRTYGARSLEAEVQLALRREGYYRGPIDGEIGSGTRASIRDYQYAQQLPVTGRIDTSLLRSLGL